MSTKSEGGVSFNGSSLSAGGNAVVIGGHVINVPPAIQPSPQDKLVHLEQALQRNREWLAESEQEIMRLGKRGEQPSSPRMQAAIKNMLYARACIETLIAAISVRGGRVKFSGLESEHPERRVQGLIASGENTRLTGGEQALLFIFVSVFLILFLTWLAAG
jgi:hypothetical protein